MARMVEDPRLVNRTQRKKLKPQKEPYWLLLEKGRSLGYRKGQRVGEWVARYYDALAKQTMAAWTPPWWKCTTATSARRQKLKRFANWLQSLAFTNLKG